MSAHRGRPDSAPHAAVTRLLLEFAARLVPRAERAGWLEEWNAELWQIRHGAGAGRSRRTFPHVLGAVPHAITTRLESIRMSFSLQDLRYAIRSVLSGRTTTLISILTLALGIGSIGTVFSLMHGVVLRPLAYPDAHQLVVLRPSSWLSGRMFRFLEAEARSYHALAAYAPAGQTLQIDNENESLVGPRVTDQFFRVLRQSVLHGRTFIEGEDEPGHAVAIISHDLWQRRFAGQSDVVGRTERFSGVSRTIVGILPPDAEMLQPNAEVVVPATLDPDDPAYDFQNLRTVVARLAPGVTRQAAEAELRLLLERWAGLAGSDPSHAPAATVVSLHEFVVGDVRPTLLLLLGAVGCTLLIVIANVTNLQLAQTLRRRQEFAIRTALGARPSRLAGQLLAETTLIASSGAVVGLLIAIAAVPTLVSLFPGDLPRAQTVRVDVLTMAFTGAIGLIAGWLIAGLPVAQALRGGLREGLGRGTRSATASRSRKLIWSGLVAAEVALALTLLIGGGLLIKSFARTLDIDPGFDADGMATVWIRPSPGALETGAQLIAYHDRVQKRLRVIPGVDEVAGALAVPILDPGWWFGAYREGFEPGPNEDWPYAHWRPITPEYFDASGIGLRRGRGFAQTDRVNAPPVAVITQHTADEWFPNEDPIGQRIIVGVERDAAGPLTVVGIVENVRYIGLREDPVPTVYRPWEQAAPTLARIGAHGRYAVLRAAGDPSSMARSVSAAMREVDPAGSVGSLRSTADVVAQSVAGPRAIIMLLTFFATASVVLGALGVYGVMAFSVGQRTRELSIRMALGATGGRVLGRVLAESLQLVGAGVVAGTLLTLALARLLERFLFQVSSKDPAVFGIAVAVLALVGLIAAYVPGRRAARLAPVNALRSE